MKLLKFRIKNFRGYQDEVTIDFEALTAFVGPNDSGKSTILEALEIFFNPGSVGVVKIEKEDVNKNSLKGGDTETVLSAVFGDLPAHVIIDSSAETTLANEFLLNEEGNLEIVKKYSNAGKEKVIIRAFHPTNPNCSDLLTQKQSVLQKIVNSNDIGCTNKSSNPELRRAIWSYYSDEGLQQSTVDIETTKEDAKNIWEQLAKYLPTYSLFQSDRKNTDGDSEIQDPLKEAVKEVISESNLQAKFVEIAEQVSNSLKDVAERTLEKLQEMNPEIARELKAVIPAPSDLKWADVFKAVSITGDEDIPINKRGSGVKRLILINFFRAQAERRQAVEGAPNIIYAVEEPETSQHAAHQKLLIDAFLGLSTAENTQVIMTTHSALIMKALSHEQIRLVRKMPEASIKQLEELTLPYPSLNEVNYSILGEPSEEYHNELYGFLEAEGQIQNYLGQCEERRSYTKEFRGNVQELGEIALSEYIRHQIHHPENKRNTRFGQDDLEKSIVNMQNYICSFL